MASGNAADGRTARRTGPEHRRVVQISDTHLSHRRAYALVNVEAILDWIESDPPDLVVHTGDITADDPDDIEEARFSQEVLRRLERRGLPLVVLPGNHDVGGFSGDLVDRRRLEAHCDRWGTDCWVIELPPWRLVGADVYRLDDPEHRQWLVDALSTTSPIVLFLHQPICLVDPDQPDDGDWSLPMATRAPLLAAMRDRPVRVVASGHLHRYRTRTMPSGIDSVWAPAASFIGSERPDGSTYRVGAVEHLLAPDGRATRRLVEPAGVTHLRMSDFAASEARSLRDAPLLPVEEVRNEAR